MKWLRKRNLLLICILAMAGRCAHAQMDEYSVKAGYIYNFSKYVTWPETAFRSPSAPFVICIAGRDPFEGRLDQAIAGKTTGDSRALEVKKVSASDRAGFRECHLVFVSKSEQGRAAAISENLKELPVFIVADFDSFAERGGIADLRIEGSKVKVDLNVGAASRVGLKISAKLQQVANLIH